MTWTRSPGSMTRSSSNARAVQTSPSIFAQPTPSELAMRSRTIALRPTSAAVPVRMWAGIFRCRRAIGRTKVSMTIELPRKISAAATAEAPSRSPIAANAAPTAKGARKKLVVAISPAARRHAATVHHTHASISVLRTLAQQRAREVIRVEGAQVLERLADPDELDRDLELVGDREGDTALGGPVELGQDDAVDVDGLGEE